MGPSLRMAAGLSVWAAALYGVLQIGLIEGPGAHTHGGISICGPWGCGPPVAALVGWHGFWLVLAAMPVGLVIRWWSVERLKLVGIGLTAIGLLTVAGIGIYEMVTWLPNIADGEPTYLIQRWLFSLATLTDIPVIPVTLSGVVMVLGAALKKAMTQRAFDHGRAEVEPDSTLAAEEKTAIGEPVRSVQ